MKISFPRMGRYTDLGVKYLRDLGLDVLDPPPITEKTISLGVRHAGAEMICFPYKVTLGSIIECVEMGATHVLQYNAGPDTFCRQKQFHRLAKSAIDRLDYKFTMVDVSITNLVRRMADLSGRSWFQTLKTTVAHFRRLEDSDTIGWDPSLLNIGVIGEVFCACDDVVNLGIYQRLERYGSNPVQVVTVADFFRDTFGWDKRVSALGLLMQARNFLSTNTMADYHEQASEYFEGGTFAGHAVANIANLLWLRDRGADGIIHLYPLSCMPETTIAQYVTNICSDAELPVMRVELDETNSEANLDTRLEFFVRLLARKKRGEL